MTKEILIQSLLVFFGFFIAGKFFAPLFGQWFRETFLQGPKRKNSQLDFDQLVEAKKSLLKKGGASPSATASSPLQIFLPH